MHDIATGMNDSFIMFALRFNFTKQGYFRTDYSFDNESWVKQTFHQKRFRLQGSVQLYKWLSLEGAYTIGGGIFYDPEDPYKGKTLYLSCGFTLQPNSKLSQSCSVDYEDFKNPQTDKRVYDALIINSRTTYQFNKYFFVRANFRYDSYEDNLLTDFLASFTLIPGTVIHVGYGSLYERGCEETDILSLNPRRMLQTQQSFFLKASYRWRL